MKCADCRHSYQGADLKLRCRKLLGDNECTEERAERCMDFEREAGADAVEASRVCCFDKPGRMD